MKRIFFFFAAAVIASASCTKESAESFSQKGSYLIGINEPVFKSALTKSDSGDGELFDSIVIDTIGGQAIRMDGYVSDICPDGTSAGTKGSIETDAIEGFSMMAYANADWHDNAIKDGDGSIGDPYTDTDNPYFGPSAVSKSTSGVWSIDGTPKWINGIDMTFWSWKGKQPTAAAGSSGYDYSSASISDFVNEGQTDLIYAYNKEKRTFNTTGEITEGSGTYNSDYKEKMNITFYHALAAVRFDVSGLLKNGLHLKKVTLSGIVKQADCAISVGDGNKLSFTWTPESTTGNTTSISTGTLADTDFTGLGLDDEHTANSLMPMTSDEFLFLIPQTVENQGIKIKIEYSTGTATETTTSEVSLNHAKKWEAGKYYTYKLSAGAVDLALNGSLTGDSPEISVKNTGSVNTYIRVAIVGNWCMEDNTSTPSTWYPLSECPASDIEYTSFNSTNDSHGGHWTLDTSDGYWYYSLPVEPDWEVDLFEGFAAKTDAVHPAGTTLRLTVIGQAVKAGDATNWAGAATVKN